jgi:hypothetical protein
MAMREGERQVAPTLAGIRRDHLARYEWAAKQIDATSVVMDVACGIGYGAWILANAGFDVWAADRDAEAIAYGRAHYDHEERISWLTLEAANVGSYPADAVVCFETIEHLEDPMSLLKALPRSIRTLLASVPNEEVFPYKNYAFHHRHYTKLQFQELLARAGWRVTDWWGQEGPESEVERNVNGRTLIAVAERMSQCPPAPPPDARAGDTTPSGIEKLRETSKVLAPQHVAIVGLGPSCAEYLRFTRGLGSRAKLADEIWTINSLGDILLCDRIFHMDDVRIQEIRAKAAPQSNIAAMLEWLKRHPGPIYTSRAHPEYPGMVAFPLEDVVNALGYGYFNNTAAYAIAFAVYIGVKRISCYGMDFTYPDSHDAEKGRGCVEFWLGQAAARGIKITVPRASSLLDAMHPELYGYDTVDVKFDRAGDRVKVTMTERERIPTAEEIEARYDHSVHPNPLVEG